MYNIFGQIVPDFSYLNNVVIGKLNFNIIVVISMKRISIGSQNLI